MIDHLYLGADVQILCVMQRTLYLICIHVLNHVGTSRTTYAYEDVDPFGEDRHRHRVILAEIACIHIG